MNLDDFESYVESIILERGIDYYVSGSVVSLDYDGTEWVAEVTGTSNYTVTVTLTEDGKITDTYCDCPYDMGEYCKHQIAVFYALKDDRKSGKSIAKKGKNKELQDLLNKLTKAALISLVMEYVKKDRRIKEKIFFQYGKQSSLYEYARNVIRSSIDKVKHRDFVEYRDVRHAVDGVDTVMDIIDDQIDSGHTRTAISLCIVILEEMLDLIQYCDDSNGTVGGAITSVIERVSEAVCLKKLNPEDSKKIFDMVFKHIDDKRYSGWTDWQIDLLFTIIPLCNDLTNRSKMEQYLAKEESALATNEWSSDYKKHQLQKLQYEILKSLDSKATADSYLELHLDNSDFRETIIENAISRGMLDKALKLCLDGERKDNSYRGLVLKWKELRYTIYEKTKDKQAQKSLGLELLHGDFKYYPRLKALYTKDEWPDILQAILEELRKNSHNYVKVLIHEKLKPQLLEYCKENNSTITLCYEHLLPDHKNEVALIFTKHIKQYASYKDGRSHYRSVCDLIREFKKACGVKAAHTVRDKLATEYARRPAFLDELSRV